VHVQQKCQGVRKTCACIENVQIVEQFVKKQLEKRWNARGKTWVHAQEKRWAVKKSCTITEEHVHEQKKSRAVRKNVRISKKCGAIRKT
jgi:hypothetical protein